MLGVILQHSICLTNSVALVITLKYNLLPWYPFVLSLKILQKWALNSQIASFHFWNVFLLTLYFLHLEKAYRTYNRQHLHTQNSKDHLVQILLAILMRKISCGVCHLFCTKLFLRKWEVFTNILFFINTLYFIMFSLWQASVQISSHDGQLTGFDFITCVEGESSFSSLIM